MRPRHVLVLLAVATAACDGGASAADEPAVLTVFAAASLAEAFEDVAAELEHRHDGLEVRLNLAGSHTLAGQLLEGADGDVFASADDVEMARVVAAGRAADPQPFASNDLVIAVEPGNPKAVTSLADLARDDLVVVLPIGDVPAGRYAAAALERAGVEVAPASLEVDVRAALGKVVLGEADAAIVYASDVAAVGGRAQAVALPPDPAAGIRYPVAVVDAGRQPDLAAEFIELLFDDTGRDLLRRHGFGAP
ncbi:MAG: molybdate ABC transporter substrate-binding protein [Egicoccus sp.]